MKKERITYFDFLRGLAIMMVVAIHTYTLREDSLVIRQLLNAAVPIFIAISGFFLSKKQIGGKSDYYSFLKKQLPKVYIPVLVWSLPLYALGLVTEKDVFLNTILWLTCGLSIYYFVAFIMQCYIALPLITAIISKNRYGGGMLSGVISFVWIIAIVYLNMIHGMQIPLILYAGLFPCWFMFFVMGVIIGQMVDRNYSVIIPVVITTTGLVLSVMESDYWIEHYGRGVDIKPSSFIYSAGIVWLSFSNKVEKIICQSGIISRFVTWIGSLSFGVYLIHCYFVNYLVLRIPIDSWIQKWCLCLLLTVVFIMILRKILPLRFHKYLGI